MNAVVRRVALAAAGMALVIGAAGRVEAGVIVDYRAHGTFTTSSPLTIDGLTATAGGGGTLSVLARAGFPISGGLGVEGGDKNKIDQSESVSFRFDAGAATAVSFGIGSSVSVGPVGGGAADMNLEGFGSSGASLGTLTFYPVVFNVDVSAAFGSVALSGFRIFGNGSDTGVAVVTVSFTPQQVETVPEPASLVSALVGVALIGLRLGLRHTRRRRRAIA